MTGPLGRRKPGAHAGRDAPSATGRADRRRGRRGRRRHASVLPSLWMILLGALIGSWLGALGLTALRNEGIRLRYRYGEAVKANKALGEEQRVLTAKVRRLRDPKRLAEAAGELGFSRPTRVISLPASRGSAEARR